MISEDVKTYESQANVDEVPGRIQRQVEENIAAGIVPFANDNPLPQDMNIVTGKHLSDVNRLQLQLKASQIGATSLKWIYGADAAFFGLHLKDTNPTEKVKARKENINFDWKCQ